MGGAVLAEEAAQEEAEEVDVAAGTDGKVLAVPSGRARARIDDPRPGAPEQLLDPRGLDCAWEGWEESGSVPNRTVQSLDA